ncbi:putative MFS family arabinose efflux permease [Pelomonas saccharophila]|uniref:MFS family arabinose efflux permease n=1 Tax=Roseateles saccharophilus TaxID=304 RepID=A0ABU1YNS9_ROSSA|nr:MFS transporter [Roseateles saccharophilus]MDR7270513.1 putative MFS family arabinose efflux permease [Roseateles saccharophilus]
MAGSRVRVVAALGTAQTLAWASSYYLPALLARPMAAELGVAEPTVFAAFSVALVVSALVGPHSGRRIDRWGGRPVLMATSGLFALGLAAMALASGPIGLFAAWLVMGVAMGSGLYEAAFASLVRLYGQEARGAITGITLIAGFASTVGWPLTAALEHAFGWRGACWAWAGLHLVLGLPLNAWLPRALPTTAAAATDTTTGASGKPPALTAALLAWVFAVSWFISTAMAAHLPRLLSAVGAAPTAVILVSALVGPAQVAGRLLEFGLLRHLHPLHSARAAALMHPLGAALLAVLGAPAVAAFALLHGAGNGILTIAKGTLPLALFGSQGYGQRQGLLVLPARLAQALSPWLFGLLLAGLGTRVLWFSAALALSALAALLLIRVPARTLAETVETSP